MMKFFLTGTTAFIEPRSYSNHFKKVLKILNMEKYHFHILRHTFATRCVKNKSDIKALSEILKIQSTMPQKEDGYYYDEEKSYCGVLGKKDPTIQIGIDRETWEIKIKGIKETKTKCNLYFHKKYDQEKIYDESTNHFDGTLLNGAIVKEDEKGNKGLYFDGIDDYVDVDDLPATIDWANGFTIETQIQALDLKQWARILDFGVGENDNNILLVVGTQGTGKNKLEFSSRYDQNIHGLYPVDLIYENEIIRIKIEVIYVPNQYTINIYKDDIFTANEDKKTNQFIKNTLRTSNYLGKSNWKTETGLFHGYIYSLKIIDANNKAIILRFLKMENKHKTKMNPLQKNIL